MRRFMGLYICCFTIPVLVGMAGVAWGQTEVRPGLNLFTLDQDVEIGKRSAIRVERELPMLSEPAVSRYVANLGSRLAAHAPTGKFTYRFKVANLADVNAFALPGGYIYVHRGLLEKVRSEGELAGVIAHEIAHVELRHSTNQASKACLAQSGIGILGGALGGQTQTTTGEIVQAVGGCGLNSLFLKYSRGAETQADIVGAQIMARAGYDPMEMVRIFELLRQQSGGDPGKAARYLSDHPAPADREARVRQEATLLGPVRPVPPVGSVTALHENLGRLAPAPTMELASAQVPTEAQSLGPASGSATISVEPPSAPTSGSAAISVELPSTRLRSLRQREGLFELKYPDNWSAYARGYGVTIAPRGGIVPTSGGRQSLACGVVVNHYVPFDGLVGAGYRDPLGSFFGKTPLEQATSDLVRQVMHANPQLQPIAGSMRHRTISGAPAFSVSLSGRSPATGVGERMIVLTRMLPDEHVIYMLFVAPAKDFDMLAPASEHMVQSLKVSARAAHQ